MVAPAAEAILIAEDASNVATAKMVSLGGFRGDDEPVVEPQADSLDSLDGIFEAGVDCIESPGGAVVADENGVAATALGFDQGGVVVGHRGLRCCGGKLVDGVATTVLPVETVILINVPS